MHQVKHAGAERVGHVPNVLRYGVRLGHSPRLLLASSNASMGVFWPFVMSSARSPNPIALSQSFVVFRTSLVPIRSTKLRRCSSGVSGFFALVEELTSRICFRFTSARLSEFS